MRTMPTIIHDPVTGQGFENPLAAAGTWRRCCGRAEELRGASMTAEEIALAEKMMAHNWTIRIMLERLFGDKITDTIIAEQVHLRPS